MNARHAPPARHTATAVALALALATGAAAATETTPWVLDRSSNTALPETERARDTVERFAGAYGKAGRPRIALFWNRELSDRLADTQRETLRVHGVGRPGAFSVTASQGAETVAAPQRSTTLSERDLWQVETEFNRKLLDAGVVLVDRATIMRLTAGAAGQPAANAQAIEMSALVGKADLFLEVLLAADASAPLGWGFRSNLKEVRSGRILGTQYLAAMPELPPAGAPSYRARNGGYDRVEAEPAKVTVRAIGETLALDSMRELMRRLPAAPAR